MSEFIDENYVVTDEEVDRRVEIAGEAIATHVRNRLADGIPLRDIVATVRPVVGPRPPAMLSVSAFQRQVGILLLNGIIPEGGEVLLDRAPEGVVHVIVIDRPRAWVRVVAIDAGVGRRS